MRPTTVPMFFLLALLAALAACGGSGSSGFDITPLAENAVIDAALASGRCGESGSLVICPAGGTAPANPGTPAPTPGGIEVQLDVPQTDSVPCSVAPGAQTCVLTLSFVPSGLPADATYRVAVRDADVAGAWSVGDPAVLGGGAFSAPLDFPSSGGRVQIAVLVFEAGSGSVAGTVQTLAETGAAFAFVSPNLAVLPGF